MDHPEAAHDGQREMEQRALRNVRSLVDKLERNDRVEVRRNGKLFAAVFGGVAVMLAVVVVAIWVLRGPIESRTFTVAPAHGPAR